MFRPIRMVFFVISLAVGLGVTGLRLAAPPTANADEGLAGLPMDTPGMEAALALYFALYNMSSKLGFDTLGTMKIGKPTHSNTDMGRSLSDLRARQTGVVKGVHSHRQLVGQVEGIIKESQRNMSLFGGDGRRGAPVAEAKRLRVGE